MVFKKGYIPSKETRRKMSESHRGKPSPNKGYLLSEEQKKRMSETFKQHYKEGKHKVPRNHFTEKVRKKLSESRIRYFDRIGRKTYRRCYHNKDKKYMEWRDAIFLQDNYTCQECQIKNGNGRSIYLEAHHIKSWSQYLDLRYDLSNGITLCKSCHNLLNNGRPKNEAGEKEKAMWRIEK